MNKIKKIGVWALFFVAGMANAAPFGGAEDVKYANDLWTSMVNESYVGDGSSHSRPYAEQPPHGAILDTS